MAEYRQLTLDDEAKRLKKLHDEGRRYSPNEINPKGGNVGEIFKRVEKFKQRTNNPINT